MGLWAGKCCAMAWVEQGKNQCWEVQFKQSMIFARYGFPQNVLKNLYVG